MALPKRGAGPLIERVSFQQLNAAADGYGNQVDVFIEQFQTRAAFLAIQPSARLAETVQADRLTGVQSFVAQIRVSEASRAVNTDWRMVDLSGPTNYAIKAINRSADRGYFDLVVQSGVAQ